MTKFNVGEKVYKIGISLAFDAKVVSVLPKKRLFSQKYLVKELYDPKALVEVVNESKLAKHD